MNSKKQKDKVMRLPVLSGLHCRRPDSCVGTSMEGGALFPNLVPD